MKPTLMVTIDRNLPEVPRREIFNLSRKRARQRRDGVS